MLIKKFTQNWSIQHPIIKFTRSLMNYTGYSFIGTPPDDHDPTFITMRHTNGPYVDICRLAAPFYGSPIINLIKITDYLIIKFPQAFFS